MPGLRMVFGLLLVSLRLLFLECFDQLQVPLQVAAADLPTGHVQDQQADEDGVAGDQVVNGIRRVLEQRQQRHKHLLRTRTGEPWPAPHARGGAPGARGWQASRHTAKGRPGYRRGTPTAWAESCQS